MVVSNLGRLTNSARNFILLNRIDIQWCKIGWWCIIRQKFRKYGKIEPEGLGKAGKMEFDQTDHIIVSLVQKLAPRVGRKGILTIFLAKLLFLVDYEYFKAIGKQATDFRYVWYKHGPYPPVQFEDRLANLENYELVKLPMTRMIDGRPYNLFYTGARPRFAPHLDKPLASILDRITDIFKDATWETLLQYVYSLDIVKGLEFGQPVDFSRVRVQTEDETFLDAVANAFKQELGQPLSTQHMIVIQHALSEPTNENMEMARRMLSLQRKASQYS